MPKKKSTEPEPLINVDDFDFPFQRATNAAAVLSELAAAKAAGDSHGDENRMWWGLREMGERILADLETMNEQYTKTANLLPPLDDTHRPTKKTRAQRKGGAR
jgi:hypothetical protein